MNAFEKYYENLLAIQKKAFTEQNDKIEAASKAIADTLSSGGMLYTFGTGHAHMLGLEIFYRAGGPVKVYPILDEKLVSDRKRFSFKIIAIAGQLQAKIGRYTHFAESC